jgi:phosphate transport system substrate-binding protein
MKVATSKRSRQPWLGVMVIAVALVVAAMALVSEADTGPRPPFVDGRAPAPSAPPVDPKHDRLHLAGSGSNLPTTRALTEAYVDSGGKRPVVHASIGSGGGLRALLDGAIDIALISRPLSDRDRAQGLIETPYAQMPVFVAVHATVPVEEISVDDLLRIYRGDLQQWPDGTPIVVLQREPGDSSHSALDRVLPQFAAVNDRAYRQGRWQVLYHDASMLEALQNIEGAIGLQGSGRGPGASGYRILRVDGVPPTVESVESDRYPFSKTLAFVTVGPPSGEVAAFIDFATGAAGAEVIRQWGASPKVRLEGGS